MLSVAMVASPFLAAWIFAKHGVDFWSGHAVGIDMATVYFTYLGVLLTTHAMPYFIFGGEYVVYFFVVGVPWFVVEALPKALWAGWDQACKFCSYLKDLIV